MNEDRGLLRVHVEGYKISSLYKKDKFSLCIKRLKEKKYIYIYIYSVSQKFLVTSVFY